jgi:capsular exopolysaccharide synthesis family protein
VNATKHDPLILTPSNLNSHFAESFRALRANISFSSIDQPLKTLLITSASPREGKTMTTLNLGIIIGQAGPRVIIVDADMRHPSLHHLLEPSPNGSSNGHRALPGLSNAIVGSSKLEDVIRPTQFANVSLVCAGVQPPNPSELLASQRMRAFVGELTQRADIVLLDSPPCLLYSDAFVLSRIPTACSMYSGRACRTRPPSAASTSSSSRRSHACWA